LEGFGGIRRGNSKKTLPNPSYPLLSLPNPFEEKGGFKDAGDDEAGEDDGYGDRDKVDT